ncbi:MAG: dynamin family protein [Phycisphaeraceae bacterium]|nr:dynamin family protein [Phycisphaeraceae bacterium]
MEPTTGTASDNDPPAAGRQDEAGHETADTVRDSAYDLHHLEGIEVQPAQGSDGGDLTSPSESPVRTRLREFSEAFQAFAAPLLPALEDFAAKLAATPLPENIRGLLAPVRDLVHQFHQLVQKIAQQQAYVLIFGPLKSGKSTFMNAMCGTYVSEVTALPAYPCMVHVAHADESGITLRQYDDQSITVNDAAVLGERIEEAHKELVATMRRLEADGQTFDPAAHLPTAIHRIDVNLPNHALAESGAVLVDTPGLYSRMRFGYDRMTRDFRNAAASAIFIVKTDNLFLEQVFEEFSQLLELFSRIFLVINVDSSKRDLAPDGTLRPSLEHTDPERIVQAFRDLSMSAPLKAAADEQRLKLYPVDLLSAASQRLRHASGAGAADADAADAQDGQNSGQAGDDFGRLLDDLTDYLNSNEYLREFLRDSVQRAASLLDECGRMGEAIGAREELMRRRHELKERHDRLCRQREAVGQLRKVNWATECKSALDAVAATFDEYGLEVRANLEHFAHSRIDSWFRGDEPLDSLANSIQAELARAGKGFIDLYREDGHRRLTQEARGLALSSPVTQAISTVGLNWPQAARQVFSRLAIDQSMPVPEASLATERIPIRKSLLDWLLFRGRTRIRRKLFGDTDQPSRPIPAPIKNRKLSGAGKKAIEAQASEAIEQLIQQGASAFPDSLGHAFISGIEGWMKTELEREDRDIQAKLEALKPEIEAAEALEQSWTTLDEQLQSADSSLEQVRDRFARQ